MAAPVALTTALTRVATLSQSLSPSPPYHGPIDSTDVPLSVHLAPSYSHDTAPALLALSTQHPQRLPRRAPPERLAKAKASGGCSSACRHCA